MRIDYRNLQRRVYDALNVLESLGFIRKQKNKIQYLGGLARKKPRSSNPMQQKVKDLQEKLKF
jgi:hypothetical protein